MQPHTRCTQTSATVRPPSTALIVAPARLPFALALARALVSYGTVRDGRKSAVLTQIALRTLRPRWKRRAVARMSTSLRTRVIWRRGDGGWGGGGE